MLDDDAVHRLFDAHRRDRGLVPERVFTGTDAIAFAEDVLPALEAGRPGRDHRGRRPSRLPRGSGGAGGPLRVPVVRGEAEDGRTDWLDLEVVISVDGDSWRWRFFEGADARQGPGHPPHRRARRLDRPEFKHLAELVAAGELHDQPSDGVRVSTTTSGCGTSSPRSASSTSRPPTGCVAAQALRGLTTFPSRRDRARAELRPYQQEGFRWLAFLWSARLGGILADDMGLGKTLQTLALVAQARGQGAGPFLVVAPTSVVSTWAHEAARSPPA